MDTEKSRRAESRKTGGNAAQLAALTREDASASARNLGEIWRSAVLDATYQCGMLLLERVYGGSEDAFHRTGPKGTSLPQVAEALQEMGFSATARKLQRMIRHAIVLKPLRLACDLKGLRHLTAGHVDEACSLPADARVDFLIEAESRRLTVIEARAARSASSPSASRNGHGGAGGTGAAQVGRRTPRSAPRQRTVEKDSPDSNGHETPWDAHGLDKAETQIEAAVTALEGRRTLTREERVEAVALSVRLRGMLERLESALARRRSG